MSQVPESRRLSTGAFVALLSALTVLAPLAAVWISVPVRDAIVARAERARRARCCCGPSLRQIGLALRLYAAEGEEGQP
jgi:hypothetical protein